MIVDYLQNPTWGQDRELKYRAMFYTILGGELYKHLTDCALARCLGDHEAYMALVQVHEGICGGHQAAENMKWVLKN